MKANQTLVRRYCACIVADEHKMAVRSIFGDTLNTVIDNLRNVWYKAKALTENAKVQLTGSQLF